MMTWEYRLRYAGEGVEIVEVYTDDLTGDQSWCGASLYADSTSEMLVVLGMMSQAAIKPVLDLPETPTVLETA